MGKNGKETRQYLSDYLNIQRMVISQERLVQELRSGMYTLSASGNNVRSNGIGDPTGNKILRTDSEERILRQMRTMLSWRRSVIDAYLSSIADPMVKLILLQHYIFGRTWKQIAVRDCAGQSEDSVRMIAVRYTNKYPLFWLA